MNEKKIDFPCERQVIVSLRAGEKVLITGFLFIARDAAHKRMTDDYYKEGKFPFDIKGQGIYYAGPAPARPGAVIGPAGPTTSKRMDKYTPFLLEKGLLLMIGKGNRSIKVRESIVACGCAYLAAAGGAAALISETIKSQEIVAYEDLGPEAIRKIYVEEFPAIVIIDSDGNNLYEIGREKYKTTGDGE
ncbi:MAG: Fe-S-containing hydro-lyase [Clostridia bacterium]|nr:Fe-S-containing hydro-lyase [Clostridia bacterium]